jgi:hypothetical protein
MSGSHERELPNAIEAEEALLGSILIDGSAMLAAKDLKPEDFYLSSDAVIFATMRQLQEDGLGVDLVTLQTRLERSGQLERAGGMLRLAGMVNATPTSAHARHYAELVKKAAYNRYLIDVAGDLAAVGMHSTNPEGAAARLVEPLRAGKKSLDDVLASLSPEELQARLDEQAPGLQRADVLMSQEFAPVLWVVPDLLPEGLTLLAAKPKLGKSWMALALGLAVANGGVALGKLPVKRGLALYLALEDNPKRLKARMGQLLRGEPAPAGLELVTDWPRLDEGGLSMLDIWLRLHPDARLVIIDTLAKVRRLARGGSFYAEDYAALEDVQKLAHRYGVSILVIHHTGKESREDPLDEVNATQGLAGVADNILVLRRERAKPDAQLVGDGRELTGFELPLRFDVTSGAWCITEPPAETLKTPERTEILRLLERSAAPMSPTQIADALGKKLTTTGMLLKKMAQAGEIIQVHFGRYAAPGGFDGFDGFQQQDMQQDMKAYPTNPINPSGVPEQPDVSPAKAESPIASLSAEAQRLGLPPALWPRPGTPPSAPIEANVLRELAALLGDGTRWLDEREVIRAAARLVDARPLPLEDCQQLLLTWLAEQPVRLYDEAMGRLAPRPADRTLILKRLAAQEVRVAEARGDSPWLDAYSYTYPCVHPSGHHPTWRTHKRAVKPVCPLCWPKLFEEE